MKRFSIIIHLNGRKKLLRGVRAFPASFTVEKVREAMAEKLLYYYFKKDILQIDVIPIIEHNQNNLAAPEPFDKKSAHVC